MPDLDILDAKVLRGFRPASRLFRGNAEPEVFATAAVKALARSLRENGGLPAANEWVQLLQERLSGYLDPHSAFARVDAIEQRLGHHRHAKVVAKAVRAVLVDIGMRRLRPSPELMTEVCERFCHGLLDNAFFGRIRPELPGKHFASRVDAMEREAECRRALTQPVRRLAASLASNPEADGLRAPPSGYEVRQDTETLLRQPIM